MLKIKMTAQVYKDRVLEEIKDRENARPQDFVNLVRKIENEGNTASIDKVYGALSKLLNYGFVWERADAQSTIYLISPKGEKRLLSKQAKAVRRK